MRIWSRAVTVGVTTLVASVLAVPAYACTGVIIGKDLTSDSSTIFGRTEDLEQNHPKRLLVHPAGQYKKGDSIPKAPAKSWAGAKWVQEKDSLKFTSVSDVTPEEGDFDEAGFNSAGVAVDATVSAKASDETLEHDPYVQEPDVKNEGRGGWEEGSLATVLLANSTSAKEGIELMAKMVDRDGMAEGDILVLGDREELWYMELYSGHQYAAMKYPNDKYSVFPNAYWMDRVDCGDKAHFICSKNLEKVAKDAGTAKYNSDGSFNPAASYNPKGEQQRANNASRVWSGLKNLDPGNPATLNQQADYKFLNSPSSKFKKLSIADAMKQQRNRFQGIDDNLAKLSEKVTIDRGFLDVNKKKVQGARYPVGNTNVLEAHIFQLPTGMPKTIPGTLWQTLGTPQGTFYLPYYGNLTSTIAPMQSLSHSTKVKGANPDFPFKQDNSSYYWVSTEVSKHVEENRARWAKQVMEYLNNVEASYIANRPSQDADIKANGDTPSMAEKYTGEFSKISEDTFARLKELRDYMVATEASTATAAKAGIAERAFNYPATDNASSVSSNKALPLFTYLAVSPIDLKAKPIKVNDKPLDFAWNLSLIKKHRGESEVKNHAPVKVTLALPKGAKAADLKGKKLYHFASGLAKPPVEVPYKVVGDKLVFEAKSFSIYGIAAGVDSSTDSGKAAPAAHSSTGKMADTGTDAGYLLLLSLLPLALGIIVYFWRRNRV